LKKNYKKAIHILISFIFILAVTSAKAQWTPTAGPYGGRINAFTVNGNNLFAGTDNGVYLSVDNGTNWMPVNSGLPVSPIYAFLINGNNIFVGTYKGVFLSNNNGNSWVAVNSGLTDLYILSFAINGNTIFAGTGSGVFVSTNNGASWTSASTGLPTMPMPARVLSLAVSGTNIFAGTDLGVYLSSDNGANWAAVSAGIQPSQIQSLLVNGTNIFAGTNGGGIFVSGNNGTSWTSLSNGLSKSASVYSLALSGTNILAGTNAGVYLTGNSGTSWTALNTGLPNLLKVYALAIFGKNLFAGSERGVYMSINNGVSWSYANTGITNVHVTSFLVNGTNILAGSSNCGVFLSVDNGINWTPVNTGLELSAIYTHSLAVIGSYIFVSSDTYGVFVSSNNGSTWSSANTGLPNNSYGYSLAVSGANIFVGTGSGIYVSSNNGISWTLSNTTIDVMSFAVNGSSIFAGAYGNGVYLSNNNGSTWAAVNTGLTNLTVVSLLATGKNLFAGTTNGVFVSSNNGTSWTNVSNGLPSSTSVNSLTSSGTKVFAGTNKGVFLTSNNGISWIPVNAGLKNTNVNSVIVNGTKLMAGSDQVYSLDLIPLAAKIQKTDAICTGSSTGSATVNATGGIMPYIYTWNTNPIQKTATATNLPSGTDTVFVTDATGASIKVGTAIFYRAAPSANFTSTSNGNVVNFSVGNAAKGIGYYWDFGDNSYSAGANPSHIYSKAGGYTVSLKVMDSTFVSCQSNLSKFITAGSGGCTTAVDFSFTQDTTAKTVSFTDKTVGNNLKWYWDFGNGESLFLQNPTGYKYTKGGAYTVCLTARDTLLNCQNRMCHNLIANNVADCQTKILFFTDGSSNAVQFDGKSLNTANSYYWSFGNGDYSNQTNPLYTYPVSGYYKVCLSTRDSILPGCQSKSCDFVHAGSGDCKAKYNALLSANSLSVNFNDASVGDATSWYWDFGDGHVSNQQNPNYKYANTGFYQVCLTVSKKGSQDSYCNTVHVGNSDCKTSFSYFTDPVKQSTEFKDLSLASPTTWSWEFGDGTISTLQNPQHTYTYAGIYTSCLSTMNAAGCISHACEDLTVGPIGNDCQAGFETLVVGDSATFKNTSTGTATTWFWDFGDQGVSPLQNPTHTYTSDGYYVVSLTMYNANGTGCFNTFYKSVSIGTNAAAKDCQAKYSYIANTASNTVSFKDESIGDPVSWTWNFPDSTSSSLRNPVKIFKAPGFYQVCLTILSSNGTSNVYCTEVGIGQTGLAADFVYKEKTTYYFKNNATYPISFYGSQYGKSSKWKWSFGDNSYDSLRINVIHNYATSGSFNACLTLSDDIDKLASNHCKIIKVGNVQGIKENLNNNFQLAVFPNPMSSQATVAYFIENSTKVQLNLMDLQGRKLKTFVFENQVGVVKQTIDLSDMQLADGLYLINLNMDGKVYNKPIVIRK
jgi:PKD repeat protein